LIKGGVINPPFSWYNYVMPKIHDHLIGLADIKDKKVEGALQETEEIPIKSVAASKWLVDYWQKLGRPETPFTDSGKKMMDIIIVVWEDLYPKDTKEWWAARADYQKNEKTITEQVHQRTGRSLASFPMPIFMMMKKIFPKFNVADREVCKKLIRRWPMFRMANKV